MEVVVPPLPHFTIHALFFYKHYTRQYTLDATRTYTHANRINFQKPLLSASQSSDRQIPSLSQKGHVHIYISFDTNIV